MEVRLDTALGVPLHLQLRSQLIAAIEDGRYLAGERLPSVRELAGFLRIHRNTVARCYAELTSAGYLRAETGRGYFVREAGSRRHGGVPVELVQETLQRLQAAGVDPAEFAFALLSRAQLQRRRPEVVFVECTQGQAELLAAELAAAIGVPVAPLLLDEAMARPVAEWQGVDLVVTTFHHAEELEEHLEAATTAVRACLLRANIRTLQVLTELEPGARVGLASTTREGMERIRSSVELAGFTAFELVEGALSQPQSLPPLLDGTALVISSSDVADVLRAFRPEARIVEDDQGLLPASVEEILSYLRSIPDVSV